MKESAAFILSSFSITAFKSKAMPHLPQNLKLGGLISVQRGHRGDFNMDIDSVHQRAGDFGSVALNLRDGASAFIVGVAIITARTAPRDTSTTSRHCIPSPEP